MNKGNLKHQQPIEQGTTNYILHSFYHFYFEFYSMKYKTEWCLFSKAVILKIMKQNSKFVFRVDYIFIWNKPSAYWNAY